MIPKVEAQHQCLRKRVLASRSLWVMSNALTLVLHLAKYLTAILSASMYLHYYCTVGTYAGGHDEAHFHSVGKLQVYRRAANTASNDLMHKRQGLYSIKLKSMSAGGSKNKQKHTDKFTCIHSRTPWLCAVNE